MMMFKLLIFTVLLLLVIFSTVNCQKLSRRGSKQVRKRTSTSEDLGKLPLHKRSQSGTGETRGDKALHDKLIRDNSMLFLKNSTVFVMQDINFECQMKTCKHANIMANTAFHMVVGTSHDNYFALFVHRVCEAFQKCIPPNNFRIVLQTSSKDRNEEYAPAVRFLEKLNIDYTLWVGVFTADTKMVNTFQALEGDKDPHFFVYQTDFDEVPDPVTFNRALKELQSGSCDAIVGRWVDRLAPGGQLNNVALKGRWSLSDQFPLRCRISTNFVGMRIEKVLMYNSMYRLDGGHHEIWCSPRSGAGSDSLKKLRHSVEEEQILAFNDMSDDVLVRNNTKAYESICEKHIVGREKSKFSMEIRGALSNTSFPARYCKTIVAIDHFKFVGGIKQYLDTRWRTYKTKGLHWWRDSYKMLVHIERHNQTICTTCSSSKCVDTSGGKLKRVEVDPSKVFYCGRRDEECLPKNAKEVKLIKANLGKSTGSGISITAEMDIDTDKAGNVL